MRKLLSLIFAIFFISSSLVQAAGEDFGLGISIGAPTGLSAKVWTNQNEAFGGGLSFSSGSYFLIYADYLFHDRNLFPRRNQFLTQLVPYLGVGGVFSSDSDKDKKASERTRFGVRIPIGVEWRSSRYPIGVYLEVAPGIDIIPSTDLIFMGVLGIRYYF